MREHGMVGEGERHVEKKRSVTLAVFFDVIYGVISQHPVDLSAGVFVVQAHVSWLLAFPCFPNVVHIFDRHAGLSVPVDDVGRLESEPFVEALIGWEASWARTKVPLAEDRSAIADIAQHLSNRDLPWVQPAGRTGCNCFADA